MRRVAETRARLVGTNYLRHLWAMEHTRLPRLYVAYALCMTHTANLYLLAARPTSPARRYTRPMPVPRYYMIELSLPRTWWVRKENSVLQSTICACCVDTCEKLVLVTMQKTG